MKRILPGEVWRVDLGLAAKVRPALILSPYPRDEELALLIVVPHTTAIRNTRWEVSVPKPFLKDGVFHLQQVQPISLARFEARLGSLTAGEFARIKKRLVEVLELNP